MSRSRILLVCTLVLALISPTAILAQEARVEFPIAVVAIGGAYEPSADGSTCELAWQQVGTPTLRVASSSGDRFRQDLMDGEPVTLPDVADGPACLFDVDVSITGGRSLTVSIEGSELVEVSLDDIENLSATMVLPVEIGSDDEVVLATDDYLDMALDLGAAPENTPAATGQSVPGVLRKVSVPPVEGQATPQASPAVLEGAPQRADPQSIEVELLVHEDAMIRMTSGCRVALSDDLAVLSAESDAGDVREELSLTRSGQVVREDSSPTGEPGCLFRTTMDLPPAGAYTFRVGEIELLTIAFEDMLSLGGPLFLEIDLDGNRTSQPEPAASPEVQAEATTGPAPQGGPIGDGHYLIAGRLDFRSGQAVISDLGCTGGSGNADVGPGAQVIVRNETGAIIGYGELEDSARSGDGGCSYDVAIVVPQAAFYVVELGDRGSVVYAFDELQSTGWRMHLETGEK